MKCQNCGAEIGNNRFCQYCGTQINTVMQRQQEQLSMSGCPKCGSTNIQFRRENQGEIRGKTAKQNVYATVGFCKDCGYTWYTNTNIGNKRKKRSIWQTILWVLGWIYIFPVPMTILLLRKKDIKNTLKYGIIAAGWLVYIIFFVIVSASSGKNDGNSKVENQTESLMEVQTENSGYTSVSEDNDFHLYTNAQIRDLMNGPRTEKVGEYVVIYANSADCTEDTLADLYFNYFLKNDFNWLAVIYTAKEDNRGVYINKGTVYVNTFFEEDEHGDYSTKSSPDELLYIPGDDGSSIVLFG